MKKRILALTLALCMLLPALPLTALAASTAPVVKGDYYNSEYARDVVFGDVPVLDWYTGQAGTAYQENFDSGKFALSTDYLSYMTSVDTMLGYGDIIVDREDLVDNFSAEIYDQVPEEVASAMNYSISNGYITRDVLGMARESNKKAYNEVQYMYAYYLDPTKETGYDGPTNIPKIIITAGEQSDEKGSIYGLYYFLQDLLYNTKSSPVLEYLRNNVILIVVPCLSPGGINQNTYWNANYVNINRNFDADFLQTGGYDFVEDANGEWVASTNSAGKTIYVKAEDGAGTHKQVIKADGLFSVDGSTIVGNDNVYTQNSGWAPFDQPEACAVRDLIYDNPDTFYFVDFHTFTSGPVPLGTNSTVQWSKMNWHSLSGTEGDAYAAALVKAANRMIDNVTEHFYGDYDLADYGCPEDQALGSVTQDAGNGWQKNWALKNGVLASVIEGTSGFPKTADYPNGIQGGRYSPACQKANSELIGNWLIQVLGEYAYDGNVPTKTFTTTFAPFRGNYPTVGGLPVLPTGKYDLSVLDAVSVGTKLSATQYPLSYHGNWTVGYKTINADGSFDSNPDNFTLFDEVWQYSSADKALYITDSHGLWATHGGLGLMQDGRNNMATAGTSGTYIADTTIRYTAEGSGSIVINVSELSFYTNVFQLVILKNGEEIGSIQSTEKTSDAWYNTSTGKWVTTGTTAELSGTFTTTVEAGDHIDFVSHLIVNETLETLVKGWNTHKEYIRRGVDSFDFSISYYQDIPETIVAKYSGKDDALNSTHPESGESLLPLLLWYNEGSEDPISAGASVANATARINDALVKAGWIELTDNWQMAIEGYKNYLRSLSTVTSVSGWMPGALEADGNAFTAGETFSPLTKATLFTSSDGSCNIFSANTSTDVVKSPYSCSMALLVSEQYFEAQLERFCQAAEYVTVSGTAETIAIKYSAIDGVSMPIVNGANGGSGGNYTKLATGVAFVDRGNADNCTETMLRTHYAENQSGAKVAAIGYTVPSGVVGTATLSLDAIYYDASEGRNDHEFALYHNGKALVGWTEVTVENELTKIQEALEGRSFSVSAGDRIELRFRVSGKPFRVSPAVTLTITQGDSYTSAWSGTTADVSKTTPSSFQPLFKWYDDASVTDVSAITTSTSYLSSSIAGADFAVINPWLILNGWIDAEDTYGEAVEKYKVYLRQVTRMNSVNAWQIGALLYPNDPYAYGFDATAFDTISDLAFLTYSNSYGIGAGTSGNGFVYSNTYRNSASSSLWVAEKYFEEMINLYCMDYTYALKDGSYQKITLADGDVDIVDRNMKISNFTTTTLTYAALATQQEALVALGAEGGAPVPWVPNGSVQATRMYTSNNEASTSAYKGVMLRPNIDGAMAVAYTVPKGVSGIAKLTLDSLTYGDNGDGTLRNKPFQWKIMVNGVDKTEWALYTPTGNETLHKPCTDNLDEINKALAALSLEVKGGDLIEFCIAYYKSSPFVSPALHVDVTRTSDAPLRRVQYATGGNVQSTEMVAAGISIGELIATYRKTDVDFAISGCYINGTWYAADAELPVVGDHNIVIDDCDIAANYSLSIGTTYAMNVYLTAPAGLAVEDIGVQIGSVKHSAKLATNGQYKVTVADVYAKDLLDTKVCCTPYYVVNGVTSYAGAYMILRATDLLNTYITGDYPTDTKALAQAALDYATVAKAYFAGAEMDAAVVTRLAEQYPTITGDTTTAVTPGDTYTFTAATLQIGETINFILAVGNKDGSHLTALPEGCAITVGGNSVSEFAAASINGQRMMVAVITGVPEEEFANAQSFALQDKDGNTLASLTYSVKDYCIRAFQNANVQDAEKNMIRAVYAIGVAAEAYQA